MKQYLDFMRHVRRNGAHKSDRTGTGTSSVFGYQMRFDLAAGFPLVTTKRVHFKSIAYELLWFLRGDTNTKFLQDHGVTIWNEWADANGELGPVYGKQWRSWPAQDGDTIDQIKEVISEIRTNPSSRRLIDAVVRRDCDEPETVRHEARSERARDSARRATGGRTAAGRLPRRAGRARAAAR